MGLAAPLRRQFVKAYRRYLFPAPTSVTPVADEVWQERQFRYYATQQPFASPLTLVRGNLTGETREMREGYREWSIREPAAKAALLTKCFAVSQLDPQTHAADRNSPTDKKASEWLKYSVERAAGGWPGLISNILLPGLIDGFSVNEKVLGKIDSRDNQYAGWWTLAATAMIDTEQIRFKLDTFRQVIGVQSVNGAQASYVLSPKDYVIYSHLKLFENPFGFSDMRAAVRACKLIESAIRLRHILLTNYSGPYLKAAARNPATQAKLVGVLENARANGWIVVPDDATVEVLDLAVANLETFRAAIEDYRQEIVQAIQGAYLQLLEGGVPDARGNTQVHKGVAELFTWWLAVTVCEVINRQVVPDLIVPNFGNRVGFPRVTLGGIDEAAVTAALQRFKAGQDIGVPISLSQVQQVGGFEAPRTGDPTDLLKPLSSAQPAGSSPPPPSPPALRFGDLHVKTGGDPGGVDPFRTESDALRFAELLDADPVVLFGSSGRG